jgi:transposase InsO family protein
MSLNAYGDDKGAASAGAAAMQAAPKLRAGGYAAWRPDMDVYLARIGADGAHKRPMEKEHWLTLVRSVETWKEEAMAEALADIGIGARGASASATQAPLTEREQATRKTIRLLVDQSTKAYGAIWSALPEELRAQASKGGEVPPSFAYGLAAWLEHKFQSTETDSIGELLAQWTALKQEDDESFDAYRARVNHLRALLVHAKEPPSDNMYAFMLLDRLQPRYKQAVLALKAGNQLKDASTIAWDTVTSLINAHERSELRLGAEHTSVDGAAMVHAARATGDRSEQQSHAGRQYTGRGGSQHAWMQQGSGGRGRGRGDGHRSARAGQDTRTCFRCDKQGHIAAVCPQPPKESPSAGRPRGAPGAAGSSGSGSGEQVASARASMANRYESLSGEDDEDDEQAWPRLASTLERACGITAAGPKAKLATYAEKAAQGCEPMHPGSIGRSATKPSPRTVTVQPMQQLDAALADSAWGWDTMASSCCSGNRKRFISLRKCPAVPVKVADGFVVQATHVGSVPLRVPLDSGRVVRIVLDNVLYHESFSSNLLSGELLTSDKPGCRWQFHSTPEEGAYVVTPGGGRATLSKRGRVAVLMCAGPEVQRLNSAVAPSNPTGAARRDAIDVEQLVRLHERLNHLGWSRMLAMLRSGKVDGLGVNLGSLSKDDIHTAEKRVHECTACIQGRATRTSFGHRGLDRGQEPGECLHMDTYQVKVERDGRLMTEYGLVVKCLRSSYVWHIQLHSKDEVAGAVVELVQLVETQFGRKVKRLYTDGGTEFINQTLKAFCTKHGKELHWTPARSQQLNGAAERTVRSFKDYERMMVLHAGAPLRLWGRAGSHAAFVWNRTHIATDTGVTPYESMRGKKPNVQHVGVWGCDAFCHVPRAHRSALAPKAEPCIYVGHDEQQNAARVVLLSTQKVIVSRDVTFRSDSFSFMRALQRGEDGLRDALAESDEYSRGEADRQPEDDHDSLAANRLSGQGAQGEESDCEAEKAAEYVVDSIVGQRRKHGRTEYKVHWAGYGDSEDSWEPEAELGSVAALDEWQTRQPQLRRSQRNAPGPVQLPQQTKPAVQPNDANDPDDGDDADGEPMVHMAMCALRGLQLPEERPEQAAVMSAVAVGIAALEQHTPRTYREAMASSDAPKWKAALDKEMGSCIEQDVWKLVPRAELPPGANVLPCKEVFKLKLDEVGNVVEHKARFTPKGFRQKHGVDFFDTYARTGQYKSLRVALSLAAKWDHELAQFDVPTAFLNAAVDEDIYMELPEGYEQPGMVCKLQKSLYGLKQAPRNWDKLVHTFITGDMAFKATVSDPSLYFKRSRSGRLMLIYRFVDDMQGNYHQDDAAEFQQSVRLLQERFRIKQLQTATWMLGMRIMRDRKARTITLSQELYVTKALEKFGLQECRVVSTPEAVGAAHDTNPTLDVAADTQRYMEITGTVMYAAISTRPDIAHAVHYLASHMQAPTLRHMQAAERVLRYLAGTKEVGLVFGSRNGGTVGDSRGRRAQVQVDVCAFADADWANDKGDRRSISGWAAKLNDDIVSWSSKKQRVVALSTCEAELYAESAAIQEVLWLRGLMEELGLHTQTGSTVYGDNQSTIAVSANGVKGERTKHVDVKYHFVTEAVERGVVTLRWVPTAQQQADIFTKALAAPAFHHFRKLLMTR